MKQNLLVISLGIITFYPSFSVSTSAQNNPFFQHAHFANTTTPDVKDDMPSYLSNVLKNAVEDTTLRTPYSSVYKTADGQFVGLYGSQIVNYDNGSGRLVPIRTDLHSYRGGWAADQQPNPCYLHLDRSTGITLDNGTELVYNANCKINGVEYPQELVSLVKNNVKLNLSPDIHKKISFLTNGIETDYTLDKAIGKTVEVSENVSFPEGYSLQPDKKRGKMAEGMWQGDYVLLSQSGEVVTRFHAPLCYDATGKNWCVGYYHDEVKDGKHVLHTVVPSAWLSKAKYPVTIDPTVMGPVARWPLTRNIPSGYYPNFVTDSIQVTIPGHITITRLYVSYCFTSNILNHIPFKDGRIFFKTPCDSTPLLECDTSGLPGYCYVDTLGNKNDFGPSSPYFHFPLTCCFNPSCNTQQFYLTVGLSRNCPLCLPKKPDSTAWLWTPSSPNPYPFYAYIVGNTLQVNSWSVSPTTTCSNQCSVDMTINAEYGVPPYTAVHPWATGSTVFGTSTTCNQSTGKVTIPLTIPGCPTYCDSVVKLTIQPPKVYDVCGDTVTGLKPITITINPVPKLTTTPDTVKVCAGSPVNLTINSCVPGASISWTGTDSRSGNTNSINYISDTTSVVDSVIYTATCSYKGCVGDTSYSHVIINPVPKATISKDTTINAGSSVNLNAGGGTTYSWVPATGLSCTNCSNPVATPGSTTTYTVTITNSEGCSVIDTVKIIVKENNPPIVIPNVITPNGDNKNDFFSIKNLEYYPNSQLQIFNRWGVKVLNTGDYLNDWNGGGQSDGTYYYILTLSNGKKYDGYLELIK